MDRFILGGLVFLASTSAFAVGAATGPPISVDRSPPRTRPEVPAAIPRSDSVDRGPGTCAADEVWLPGTFSLSTGASITLGGETYNNGGCVSKTCLRNSVFNTSTQAYECPSTGGEDEETLMGRVSPRETVEGTGLSGTIESGHGGTVGATTVFDAVGPERGRGADGIEAIFLNPRGGDPDPLNRTLPADF